jgi:ubiquitin-conjugating enzyme E2 Q
MATGIPAFKAAFDKFIKGEEETASMRIKSIKEDVVEIQFEDFSKVCTITVPDDNTMSFYVHSEAEELGDWVSQMNDFCEKCGNNAQSLLSHMATTFMEISATLDDYVAGDDYDDAGYGDDDYGEDGYSEYDPVSVTKPEPKVVKDEVDVQLQKERSANMFMENIGSKGATMRLFDDLKHIRKSKPKELGFSCQPVDVNGKINLYEWEVRLFDFEEPLAGDMRSYHAKTGKNYVTLIMKFSSDYPFKPPFIRVIEPRFQFRTGHVTLGGAICMELLTVSGWTANNDIISILIQVRAEIGSKDGGARLAAPSDQSQYTPYSEQEAWTAYYRAASTHGWKTEGLGPNMFPKIN